MGKLRITIPDDIAKFVEAENCDDFDVDKYFVTQTQIDIIKDIERNGELCKELAVYGVQYVNTTLLYGPTGTGKTTFARFVAHSLDKDFAYVNFSSLMDGGFGNTERNLSKVFRYMTAQDCIFMIDEIDCIATSRTASTNDTLKSITIALMQELDYCKAHSPKAIILAATNVVDNLDPALLSRFSIKKEIPLLNNEEKLGFVCKYMNSLSVPYDLDQVREYIARNSRVTQRVMEQDIIRALIAWIDRAKEGFVTLQSYQNY
ncbi:ATPase AAA family (plasmid) [Butyrivibrio proteoclasticus B316]|uniref:ATPase AAA family n=1 Tax=Butyrivibrio proteoclasticus (strain ATCC 51982 / DSM 14932 / B316) TaxID=515622 RepID=E0S4W3_BUTPB|nr:ATP-binding protein [Butyrivibrio proteoclasticus]ADL36445.1 ATPase AAA family [Butyrivibrio proteoclasticus B316]